MAQWLAFRGIVAASLAGGIARSARRVGWPSCAAWIVAASLAGGVARSAWSVVWSIVTFSHNLCSLLVVLVVAPARPVHLVQVPGLAFWGIVVSSAARFLAMLLAWPVALLLLHGDCLCVAHDS